MKLNILNGDSTLHNFNQSGMQGEVVVWREILAEGPVSADVSYPDFFALREAWVSKTFNLDQAEYQTKVINEFKRLSNLTDFREVILWFEFDLHCQINLIFLLDYFHKIYSDNTKLFLICPASHPKHPDFRGIGELSPEEFAELPFQRILLDRRDLAIASQAWKTYCSGNSGQIKEFLSHDHGHLDKLKPALLAHLDRFPNEKTGLNIIEERLLEIINSGFTDRSSIYPEFWKSAAIYGMGDLQIDIYIKRLADSNLISKNLK